PGFPTVGGTKDPDVAGIVALAPDLVVVNDEENRREDADALQAAGLALHVTSVHAVADVAPCLTALAEALHLPDFSYPSAPLPALRGVGGPGGQERRVFVPIWRRPWMTLNADTYGSSVLAALGLVNIFADASDRYPETTLADAADRRPDVVL